MGPGFYALLGIPSLVASDMAYKSLPMNISDQKAGVALVGLAGLASLAYAGYETICRKSER